MRQGKRKDIQKTPAREALRAEEPADPGALLASLAYIMAESWRFSYAMEKAVRRMDPMEGERFARQYSYFATRVREAAANAGLNCIDLTGQPYDTGMAVTAMNLEEFGEDEPLRIGRMIEPVIMSRGRVLRTGIAMLTRDNDLE